MPTYEYQCKKCGREFEYQQRMSDPEKTLCEACGAEALERMISRTAFALKGGGWYKDLYASSKPEKPEKSEKSAGETTGTPASTDAAPSGGEAKPAAAAPAAAAPATPSSTPASTTSSGDKKSGSGSSGASST